MRSRFTIASRRETQSTLANWRSIVNEIREESAALASADEPSRDATQDPSLSELITLAQAADELPRRRGGRKTHRATLYRWTDTGCRGVKLQFTQVGATRCTT